MVIDDRKATSKGYWRVCYKRAGRDPKRTDGARWQNNEGDLMPGVTLKSGKKKKFAYTKKGKKAYKAYLKAMK